MEAKLLVFVTQVVLSTSSYDYTFHVPLLDDIWYRDQAAIKLPTPTAGGWLWLEKPAELSPVEKSMERECLVYGASKVKEKDIFDAKMKSKNMTVPRDSPTYVHQTLFKRSSPRTVEMSKQGYMIDHATTYLKRTLRLNKKDILDMYQLGSLVKSEFCDQKRKREEPPPCDPNLRYRSTDGSCNNLQNPTWGATDTPFRRIAPPDYGDGVSTLRLAKDGFDLPSARLVSSRINIQPNDESASLSVLHMTFGQFLDHDLDFGPVNKAEDGEAIPCCPDAADNHPECAPIAIPADDAFYSQFNRTCMEFVRSAPCPRCHYGPREQMNEQSAYIDGSQIYDRNATTTESLRSMQDGMLFAQVTNEGEELLPPLTDETNKCNKEEKIEKGLFCFRSGDHRINEQVLLALFHVVWARHHNRIAKGLKEVNPSWSDETLFQESRRIVVAQLQHVTYNEYLPAVFGDYLMDLYNLRPLVNQKFHRKTDYSNLISAGISNEFATAAFRFGHSQISGHVESVDEFGDISCEDTSSLFMNPFDLYRKGAMSQLLKGEIRQSATSVDPFFTPQVAGKMFRGEKGFGLDLLALSLQRGRDNGIASYTTLRKACGFKDIKYFSELSAIMDRYRVSILQKLYNHVDDIDLVAGGLSERPHYGSILGPTFTCILLDQFYRIQKGDRFWYETDDRTTGFTNYQLTELRQTTLSSIMCGAIPELRRVQPEPLRVVSPENPMQDCSHFKSLNLIYWKEWRG